jgi:hypothetical protein
MEDGVRVIPYICSFECNAHFLFVANIGSSLYGSLTIQYQARNAYLPNTRKL